MKIIWSPLAQNRIIEIAEYIAKDNVYAAENWVKKIYDRVKVLKEFPKGGRIVPEVGKDNVREIFHGDYRVIYRIEKEQIQILTVRHGKQLLSVEDADTHIPLRR